ncbi:hypothetical protein MLD38_021159 [Melastoma candidum]|uniref:Uncharacterized protein n=1 Tax=Melastoma candidum TaxID=119954 RepID=A0ACB9QFH0_9MYRT|nr:hypothetical protein MLD38_021159 [Melastoma candidum]
MLKLHYVHIDEFRKKWKEEHCIVFRQGRSMFSISKLSVARDSLLNGSWFMSVVLQCRFEVTQCYYLHDRIELWDVISLTIQNCSVEYAIAAPFVFIGRLIDRCLETAEKALCSLLPTVVVFSEWLATSNLDSKEISGGDEMSRAAKSYFFLSFIGLLNTLNSQSCGAEFEGHALWEDYELRGISTTMQAYLDCSYDSEHVSS